jgi:hypothetical protein
MIKKNKVTGDKIKDTRLINKEPTKILIDKRLVRVNELKNELKSSIKNSTSKKE